MRRLLNLFLITAITFTSCNIAEFDQTKVPINTTLPLADFNISDNMLLSWAGLKDEVIVGNDDILQINKSMSMVIGTAKDLENIFNIPKQEFSINQNFGGVLPVDISFDIKPVKVTQSFSLPNGYKINSAVLNDGVLSYEITNTTADLSKITCTINQLTKNNIPLTIKPGEVVSLQGYTLSFDDGNSNISLVLAGKISAKVGNDISAVKLNVKFLNLAISQAKGFFGRTEVTPNEEFTIAIDPAVTDFFKNCEYYLTNPNISLNIENEQGLPMLIKISSLKISNSIINLKGGVGNSSFLLNSNASNKYSLSNASTVLGDEISKALAKGITSIAISFTVITNPTKEDVGDNAYIPPTENNISSSKSIKMAQTISLPFSGTFTDIPFSQEFSLDFGKDEDKTVYESFKLAITCNNQMPLDLKLNLVAIDNNNTETILFDTPILIPASNGLKPTVAGFKAGVIDESNVVINTMVGDKVETLMKAKKLRLDFKGSMPIPQGGGYANFYSPTQLKLKLIGNLKGEI